MMMIDEQEDDNNETTIMDQSVTLELSMSKLDIQMSPQSPPPSPPIPPPNEMKRTVTREYEHNSIIHNNNNSEEEKEEEEEDDSKRISIGMGGEAIMRDYHKGSIINNDTTIIKQLTTTINRSRQSMNSTNMAAATTNHFEKLYVQSYKDLIFQIISRHGNHSSLDPNTNHNTNTNNNDSINVNENHQPSIDERINTLYQRLEDEGVNTLLSKIEQQGRSTCSRNHEDMNDNNSVGEMSIGNSCTYYDDDDENKEDYDINNTIDNHCKNTTATTRFDSSCISGMKENTYLQQYDHSIEKNYINQKETRTRTATTATTAAGNKHSHGQQHHHQHHHHHHHQKQQQNKNNGNESRTIHNQTYTNTNLHDETNYDQQDEDHNGCMNRNDNDDDDDDDDSTVSSIELGRHSKKQTNNFDYYHDNNNNNNDSMLLLQSPDANVSKSLKKRMATTSGKRGTDLRRMRMSQSLHQHHQHHQHQQQDEINNDNVSDVEFDLIDNDNDHKYHDYDDDHFTHNVDGIMNATTHYDPILSSPMEDEDRARRRMSFLDNVLHSQSPIPRRQSLQSPTMESMDDRVSVHDIDTSSYDVNRWSKGQRKIQDKNKDKKDLAMNIQQHQKQRQCSYEEDSLHKSSIDQNNFDIHDSIESVESHILEESNDKNDVHEESCDDDIDDIINSEEEEEGNHHNVSLRQNSNFYLDPLKVYRPPRKATSYHVKEQKSTKSKGGNKKRKGDNRKNRINVHRLRKDIVKEADLLPTCTFVNEPFKQFGTRAADRLGTVLDWLLEKDVFNESSQRIRNEPSFNSSHQVGRAVVISIPLKQIMVLCICTIFKNGVHQIPRSSRPKVENGQCRSSMIQSNNPIYGGTLIVLKSKDETAEWLNILREKTSFSVLNHCEISSTERRRARVSAKCASYDIVLTTYDALKAKEVTTYIDERGRAVRHHNSQGGEWISSGRSSINSMEESQKTNKILSRVHCIEWTRVLFTDILGRVSYLTKPGTARLEAATALVAKSRLIFFIKPPDDGRVTDLYFFEDKLKESRRQLVPLAQILGLPENRTGDKIVGQAMLDFRDVKESEQIEPESSCGESLFDDCSLSEDVGTDLD